MTSNPNSDDPSPMAHRSEEPEDPAIQIRPLWLPKEYEDGWPTSYQSWAFRVDHLFRLLRQHVVSMVPKTPYTAMITDQIGGLLAALHREACRYLDSGGYEQLVGYMDSRMDMQSRTDRPGIAEPNWKPGQWTDFRSQVSALLTDLAVLLARLSHVQSLSAVQHDLLAMTQTANAPSGLEVSPEAGLRRTVTSRSTAWRSLTKQEQADIVERVLIRIGRGARVRQACESVGVSINTFKGAVKRDPKLRVLYEDEMAKRRAVYGPRQEDSYLDPEPDLDSSS